MHEDDGEEGNGQVKLRSSFLILASTENLNRIIFLTESLYLYVILFHSKMMLDLVEYCIIENHQMFYHRSWFMT